MESARAKINAAATATDRVGEAIVKAIDVLGSGGSHVTVLGIYSDPYRQRAALAAAREAIERAEKIMQETQWPAPEDYDAV
jgi:hypothetical protein